jgi:putative ABC transport system permease protein
LALGVVAALAFGGLLTRILFAVQPRDGATIVAAPVVLAAVALIACLVPARRATRVDPAIALRTDP